MLQSIVGITSYFCIVLMVTQLTVALPDALLVVVLIVDLNMQFNLQTLNLCTGSVECYCGGINGYYESLGYSPGHHVQSTTVVLLTVHGLMVSVQALGTCIIP